jgi:hypothetical protein
MKSEAERQTKPFFNANPSSYFTIYYSLFTDLCGGQGRDRTADAGLFRAALYQLSYLANR